MLLRQRFNHIGEYSGYENFIRGLKDSGIGYKEVTRKKSISRFDIHSRLMLNKFDKTAIKNIGAYYNKLSFLGEAEAFEVLKQANGSIIHNTHLEDNHGFLGLYKSKKKFSLIATSHQPTSWWKYTNKNVQLLQQLDMLICFNEMCKEYFENYIQGRVIKIHHAVDTNFFKSDISIEGRPHRILFVGNWLRNVVFFEKVISELIRVVPEVYVDIVYKRGNDLNDPIFKLCRSKNVNIHQGISNEELRKLYNSSRILFLPLIDSTANNALLEAAACGLSVVTTDLESTREYSSCGYTYYYKQKNDCLEYLLETIKNDGLLQKQSDAATHFIQNFSMRKAAEKHAELYREFINA